MIYIINIWCPFHMIFIWKRFIWFIWFTYDAPFIWFSYSYEAVHIWSTYVYHMLIIWFATYDSHMMPFLWFSFETKHIILIWYSYVNHMWLSCLCIHFDRNPQSIVFHIRSHIFHYSCNKLFQTYKEQDKAHIVCLQCTYHNYTLEYIKFQIP